MSFFSRLFSRSAEDHLAKGDKFLESDRFFEARNAFEKGLECHLGTLKEQGEDALVETFNERIARANTALAELNLHEAKCAARAGTMKKAIEHLELAKTLSVDSHLREKAEKLLAEFHQNSSDTGKLEPAGGGCSSCSSSHAPAQADTEQHVDPDMSVADHYDLLIRQLPAEMYGRYAQLGEKFACMYLAASRDEHFKALRLLDEWYQDTESDIYWYERGMILYRIGKKGDAEKCLRSALRLGADNPLPSLGLALLLIDGGRFGEAAALLDRMISGEILTEQALMLRGEVSLLSGHTDDALERFAQLLTTPLARPAAEKLYGVLMETGREQEAKQVFKRYLGGCKH